MIDVQVDVLLARIELARAPGRFELGETQIVELSYAVPTILGLSHTMERITSRARNDS